MHKYYSSSLLNISKHTTYAIFSPVLFIVNLEGERITYNAIRLMINRVSKRSKVKRLHPHLLRHTFATKYLIKTKGDITSLKVILGHTSLKVVENYLHLAMSYSIGQYREFCD